MMTCSCSGGRRQACTTAAQLGLEPAGAKLRAHAQAEASVVSERVELFADKLGSVAGGVVAMSQDLRRDLRRGPGSRTLEQLSHRRAVEGLVVERRFVPELDAERVELDDAMEVRRWSEAAVVAQVEQEADRARARESIPCTASTALSSFSAAC